MRYIAALALITLTACAGAAQPAPTTTIPPPPVTVDAELARLDAALESYGLPTSAQRLGCLEMGGSAAQCSGTP